VDFESIVAKLENQLIERGLPESDARAVFGPASDEDLSVLTDLYGTFSSGNPAYSEEEMAELKEKQVPPTVLAFYRQFAPQRVPMLKGYVRLLRLAEVREESTELAPGSYLIRFGVLVFASTVGGHAICMDLNRIQGDEPRIILVDHSFCVHDPDTQVVECAGVSDEVYEEYRAAGKSFALSYELIARCCPELAPMFSEFLGKLADGDFEDVERFLP
jgi:hypothetical protein